MPLEKGEAMRSRTNQINVWLSDEELAGLNEKGPKIRSSRERFIRQCIKGEQNYDNEPEESTVRLWQP